MFERFSLTFRQVYYSGWIWHCVVGAWITATPFLDDFNPTHGTCHSN